MQLCFPLPTGYFAKFDLLSSEVQDYRTLANDIVWQTQQDLRHYVKEGRNLIDAHTWELAKSKERLHCYRRRGARALFKRDGSLGSDGTHAFSYLPRSRSSLCNTRSRNASEYEEMSSMSESVWSLVDGETTRMSMQPAVIGYGLLEGTVDDLVFGLYHSSVEEMKTLSSFLGDGTLIDCAVLKTIRQTRSSYLGLKWKLSRTAGGNQDCCYLEYIGVSKDANGQNFGYHVLQSVAVHNCPRFDDNSIVRTNVSFCFIFRPGKLADHVEVFMEGAYDSSGNAITAGGVGDYHSMMDMLFNLPSALAVAEAKKISVMVAIQSGALRGSSNKNQSGNHCSICRVKSTLFSSHTNCDTCGAVICSKCRVRKVTFARRGKVKVSCCKMCLVMVKDQSPFAGEHLDQQQAKRQESVVYEDRPSRDSCSKMDAMNVSISTMSLTDSEFSSSSQSWQSSSVSSLQSDHDDSFYTSNGPSSVSFDRKMPALMESDMQMCTATEYDIEQQYQYEQQQYRKWQHTKQNAGFSVTHGRSSATREDLYNKMLELQIQAEKVYNMTNYNANMMNLP